MIVLHSDVHVLSGTKRKSSKLLTDSSQRQVFTELNDRFLVPSKYVPPPVVHEDGKTGKASGPVKDGYGFSEPVTTLRTDEVISQIRCTNPLGISSSNIKDL
jgi:hypothetical protein